jgi:hypothetical protein
MRPKLVFTPTQVAEIINLYHAGHSSRDIGRRMKCDCYIVLSTLRANQIPIRKTWTRKSAANDRCYAFDDRLDEIKEQYDGGASLESLAHQLGVAGATMSKILRRAGASMRSRGPKSLAEFTPGEIKCSRCKQWKALSDYANDAKSKSGKMHVCKGCQYDRSIQRLYGVTSEKYDSLLQHQCGLCAICGASADSDRNRAQGKQRQHLCVDHDHETNAVRGLICHHCNMAIGLINDSPTIASRMSAYLQAPLA